MARSIHVEVRKAIIEGLVTAFDSEPDVSVTYGWQGSDDTRQREQVFTSNARATHEPAALKSGRSFRDEEMAFDLSIYVAMVGDTIDVAETRAMELGEIVEEFIADHKSNELGVTGLIWLQIAELAADYRILPAGGSFAMATYTINYRARLT